jgi:oxygen-independent coproporphyrinogen-3 oxidase
MNKASIESIFIGGGTPSLLKDEHLSLLLGGINRLLGGRNRDQRAIEWTIEANPESLDKEFLQICAANNVNRLSIGMQSFNDDLLNKLGRLGNSKDNLRALDLVEKHWSGRVSIDLLAGIPGQKAEYLVEELNRLCSLSFIKHISLYTLTPLEGTLLDKQVNDQDQEEVWLQGSAALRSRAFNNYEIANFSLPGEESLHNLRYWHLEPYLGLGPAAVSTLPGERGEVLRLFNPEDVNLFLAENKNLWGTTVERVPIRDFLFETLMMGLRLKRGIPIELFSERFGRSPEILIGGLWQEWRRRKLARSSHNYLALSARGRLHLDSLLVELSEYLDDRAPIIDTALTGVLPFV